jgi:hypothetical protein
MSDNRCRVADVPTFPSLEGGFVQQEQYIAWYGTDGQLRLSHRDSTGMQLDHCIYIAIKSDYCASSARTTRGRRGIYYRTACVALPSRYLLDGGRAEWHRGEDTGNSLNRSLRMHFGPRIGRSQTSTRVLAVLYFDKAYRTYGFYPIRARE